MNKSLAFCQRRIPYLPELRSICSSVNATILLQQLEYWFSLYPQGFYKFLNPCENHSHYRSGDSWTEELCFSSSEFRDAYDHIGIRYKSKQQLEEAKKNQEDIFVGKYYLSYIDRRNGLTYYQRNHELINQMIEKMMPEFNTLPLPILESPSADIKQSTLGKSNFLISRRQENLFDYKETKITTKINTKITAAGEGLATSITQQPAELQPDYVSAAAVKNNLTADQPTSLLARHLSQDQEIGTTLNDAQIQFVKQRAEQFKNFVNIEPKLLAEGITQALLDPQQFTQARRDFSKKLNTICKCIHRGQWTVPNPISAIKKEITVNKAEQKITWELTQLKGDVKHWESMLEIAKEKPTQNPTNIESLTDIINKSKSALLIFIQQHGLSPPLLNAC